MAEQTPPLGQPPVLLPTRPLALGAFPLPFGYLLLPAGEECDSVRDGLLAGRLPEAWPELLRAHELAVAGDFDGAMAALTAQDPVSLFNRYVLDPDRADPAEVRAGLGVELAVLFDLVEFAIGRSDTAPDPDGLDGELAALALAAQAAAALDGTDPHGIEVAEPIAL
ncbi:MAG: hypothetical protein J0H43_03020, partial [Actinobacteria bacterium]|nr:hypothetical protein [Actinomycetota bacterium]